MKKLTLTLLASFLMLGAVACSTARTTSSAPDAAQPEGDLTKQTAEDNQGDATSELRRRQLNADIQAREQRNNLNGGDAVKADTDLASQVRSKLEANLPAAEVTVEAKDGVVTVAGTVVDQEQFDKIEPLTREIKGVQSVVVDANLKSAAEPGAAAPDASETIDTHTNTDSN